MAADDLDWQKARYWVLSTNVDSMNGQDFLHSEELLDFAEGLRDGVIICDIANMLKRGCVKLMSKVNNVNKHEYLCRRNIGLFLSACQEAFGIDQKKLFTANDLYHVTNFKAVLGVLSILSNTYEATAIRRLTPFSLENKKKTTARDEELYSTLPEILEQKESVVTEPTLPEENIYDEVTKYEDKTYDLLVNYNKLPERRSSKVPAAEQPDKRSHIINEILTTENGYIQNLEIIVKQYISRLKSHVSGDDIEKIFINTGKLLVLHLNFNRELANKKIVHSTGDNNRMDASAFITHKERFLIYSEYCSKLEDAKKHIMQLSKNSGFRDTVESLNKELNRKFPLQEQLAVAFQRILKYPLLLRDLKKHTAEDHEDFKKVQEAFDAMDDVAKYINDYKGDIENFETTTQIVSTLKHGIDFGETKQYGRHIKDGEMRVLFVGCDKKENRFAFLFDHALVLCKNKGDTNEVKESFDLDRFLIIDVHNVGRGKYEQGFSLQARENNGVNESKNCTIFAKTQQEKIYWLSEIAKCIKTITLSDFEGKLDNHKLKLTTYKEPESCGVCKRLLKGQLSQGYKCTVQGCDLNIHKKCLSDCPKCDPPKIPSQKPKSRSLSSHPIKKKLATKSRDKRAQTLTHTSAKDFRRASIFSEKFEDCSWFAGLISRDEAAEMLVGTEDGDFLIRESERGGLVISIQYNKSAAHIRISEKDKCFFLSESKLFPSVQELLSYYQSNTLKSSFPTVPIMLIKKEKTVLRNMVVIYNWEAKTPRELSLTIGQEVQVLNEESNWWFGICEGVEGYFPKNYVKDL